MSKYKDSEHEHDHDQNINVNSSKRVRFDGTVTLGNVLTFIGMVSTIIALWRNMESRILIVEERLAVQSRSVDKLLLSVEQLTLIQAGGRHAP